MFTVFKCVSFCHAVQETARYFLSIIILLFLSSRCDVVHVSSPKGYHKILAGFG